MDAQYIYFNKRIDITNGDWDLCTSIITQGNGYLVIGDCGPSRHIYLSKLGSFGNLKWTNLYDEAGFTYYMGWSGALFQSKDNYFSFCGMRVGGPKGYGILIKVDSSGNKKWEKEYQLLNNDNAFYSGNTTALNTQVELSQPPQALQLRNNLLSKSPYLSDSVMITAIINEDALPPVMLKQVLVANPQSSKSETLMDNLLNRNNPLPEYMITEIEAGRNLVSAKENLEAKIAYYYQEKELAYNEILRRYKNDTIHNWATDSIAALLGRTPSTWAKYYLTFDKLYNTDYVAAGQLLANIPLAINLNAEEQNNYNDYYDYLQVLIQLQQDSNLIYKLEDAQRQTLNTLASKGNNYANAYARNLLIIADSIAYNEPIILPQTQNKSKQKPNKPLNGKETDAMLKVFPNPAKDYFTVEYKLSETAGSAIIEITDLTGKKLRVLPIYDKQNQLILETNELQTGIYYIRLLVDGATSNIQKISVIK